MSDEKAEVCSKRACLGGKDIADLLEGKVIRAFGVEFVYDGIDAVKVKEAADTLGRKSPVAEPARHSKPARK